MKIGIEKMKPEIIVADASAEDLMWLKYHLKIAVMFQCNCQPTRSTETCHKTTGASGS